MHTFIPLRLLVPLALLVLTHAAVIDTQRRTEIKESSAPSPWKLHAEEQFQSRLAGVTAKLHSDLGEHRQTLRRTAKLHSDLGEHQPNLRRTGSGVCQYPSFFMCQYTTCAACLTASNSYFWIGYCTPIAQTAATGFMGVSWTGAPSTCGTEKESRELSLRCEKASDNTEATCTAANVNGNGANYYRSVAASRTDFKLASSFTLLNFDTGEVTSSTEYLSHIGMTMYQFSLSGGYPSFTKGPPSLYQGSMMMTIPIGGFSNTALMVKGSQTYIVYDAAFTYAKSAYPEGVGTAPLTLGQTAVPFVASAGFVETDLVITGTGLNTKVSMHVCSTSTAPKMCLKMKVGATGFEQDGLTVSSTATKVDLFLKNPAYAGGRDSSGVRVIGVSMSVSGSVSVADTGNSGNEESTSLGAAYFITEKTVGTKSSAIATGENFALLAKNVVKKNSIALVKPSGVAGKECGFAASDWYNTANGGHANAYDFFKKNNFGDMECMLFSFENTAAPPPAPASHINTPAYIVWDPILGIDPNAVSTSSSDSGLKTWVIAVIVVSCVLVVVGGVVAGVMVYKKKAPAPAPIVQSAVPVEDVQNPAIASGVPLQKVDGSESV